MPGYEPVYKGKEVDRFIFKRPSGYIKFEQKKFQQVAAETRYRVPEKLVYRFIFERVVIAYDNQQRLTLNSANIFVPLIKDYPMKAIMALFNSSLYQFIFRKKFFTRKVLRSHLEQLPLPLFSTEELNTLVCFADILIQEKLNIREREKQLLKLEEYIYYLFGITNEEREVIENSI